MASEEERELVRRLQAVADGYEKGEVELNLADQPRLYRLPKCKTAGMMHYGRRRRLSTNWSVICAARIARRFVATHISATTLWLSGPRDFCR
jgi:hypothetical protein